MHKTFEQNTLHTVYLLLYKMSDTPFHIQGGDIYCGLFYGRYMWYDIMHIYVYEYT